MVAGGLAFLRISDPLEPSNSVIRSYMQLFCVIILTIMSLWCVFNTHCLFACTSCFVICLLYIPDAADEEESVDLGGALMF